MEYLGIHEDVYDSLTNDSRKTLYKERGSQMGVDGEEEKKEGKEREEKERRDSRVHDKADVSKQQ